MKSNFIKLTLTFCFFVVIRVSFGQQIEIALPGFYGGTDKLTIISSNGNLGGTGIHTGTYAAGADIISNVGVISQAFSTTPTAKLLKATAGKSFQVSLFFDLYVPTGNTAQINDGNTVPGGIGKNEQGYAYDQYITMINSGGGFYPNHQTSSFTNSFTFQVGRTQAWLVFAFVVNRTIPGVGSSSIGYTVAVPYVVEGPSILLSQANPVAIKGYIREPAIPQMILHNPPGDLSSVTFQTNQEACRSMSESLTTEESNTGKLNVTLGIAGSAGLFVTTNFEFSVTASVSGGGGGSVMKSSGKQNCVSILNAISTAIGAAPANQGSIYLGYSSDIAYGVFPNVFINTSPTISVQKDSSLIFGLVPGSASPFYYTRNDILNDIVQNQAIINNPANPPKLKHQALSQIRIWQQVLAKDSININNPSAEVITPPFTLTGNAGSLTSSVTQSVTTTDSYDVSHFLELGAGVSFVIKVGGSGVDGGYEFKTKKTMGTSVSNSSNTSTTVSYFLQDNDPGDVLRIKIIKDKTYGTPIFLLDQAQSKTSCPFEGGYKRDQPRFEIVGLPTTKKDTTIANVSLGTSGTFLVRACNSNTTETRSYDFGFSGESILTDLKITSAGSEGNQLPNLPITKFLKIIDIPAGGCKTGTFDINMSRRNPASAMSYSNIEFQLFSECEPAMKSSLFANINFAGPPPPTGVAASKTEICNGTPVTLTANCPVTTTPVWYTVAIGGFPAAIGSSVTVNPTTSTIYYVGCETSDYKRDRVATKLVLVGTPSTVLNLTTNFTTGSTLQIATNTITATNKVISPAYAVYKAGKSISFGPGFEARSGSLFVAQIGGCNN